jgi:hypothetical protein
VTCATLERLATFSVRAYQAAPLVGNYIFVWHSLHVEGSLS